MARCRDGEKGPSSQLYFLTSAREVKIFLESFYSKKKGIKHNHIEFVMLCEVV